MRAANQLCTELASTHILRSPSVDTGLCVCACVCTRECVRECVLCVYARSLPRQYNVLCTRPRQRRPPPMGGTGPAAAVRLCASRMRVCACVCARAFVCVCVRAPARVETFSPRGMSMLCAAASHSVARSVVLHRRPVSSVSLARLLSLTLAPSNTPFRRHRRTNVLTHAHHHARRRRRRRV